MRLAIAQPGAQSVTAMGLIAPVYASGLPSQAPQLAIVQSHLQMLCTGVHEHSLQVRCWQSTVAEGAVWSNTTLQWCCMQD